MVRTHCSALNRIEVIFQTSPDGVFLQQQFDKLSRNVQGERALRHLLQYTQVVPVGGGETVRPRHDTAKH